MRARRRRRRTPIKVADPLPDLPRIRPTFQMLSREDCLRLHHASCEVLKNTGVRVLSRPALQLLAQSGAWVDADLVRMPSSLVEWALKSVPSSFNLHRRGSDEVAIRLDGKEVYFGPGSDTLRYLDPLDGGHRPFKLADVANCAKLCDQLSGIDFMMSVGIPRDVPGERHYRYQFAAMLRHTVKPIVFVCDDLQDMEAITTMAAVAAGGRDRLVRYPNILLYSEPSSPLLHSADATEKLLFCAKNRVPVTHSPAPMIGGTAPITLAGAVVLGNAEILSSLVMHQLKNPGAPFLYGHGVHHLDMKEMVSVYGAPEFQLARVMAAEMGRFYRLPVWGYAGHSDSKVVDGQAAADAQFSVLVAFLAKTNLNHDVGYLESGLTGSPEMIVLTNELISMTRRFMAGVRIDDEAIALNVIHEIGPGGEFLTHDHTLAHWRELWLPQLFDRMRLEKWQEQGSKALRDRLREVTIGLIEARPSAPLADDTEAEIQRILVA